MIPSTRKTTQLANRRTGAVAPLVGVLLLVILVAGGIAIDHARLRLTNLELRAAADNVARSVSNELLRTDSTDAAITKGLEIAAKYRVGGGAFSLASSDIKFGKFDKGKFTAGKNPPNAVRVNSNRSSGSSAGPLNMIFGAIFGVNEANIGQFATASFKLVDICFVLDRSSSMKLTVDSNAVGLSLSDPRAPVPPYSDSRWRALDTAFDMFIDELNSNNLEERVGIVSFASDFTAFGVTTPASRVDMDLTSNLANAKSQMNNMSNSVWNGNTYIEAGMRQGIGVLNYSSGARINAEKTLIVLTDGRQNQGEARLAAADAVTDNITIHTITFGDYADKTLMAEIAVTGSGKYAHADDAAGLQKILRDLAVTLTTLVE